MRQPCTQRSLEIREDYSAHNSNSSTLHWQYPRRPMNVHYTANLLDHDKRRTTCKGQSEVRLDICQCVEVRNAYRHTGLKTCQSCMIPMACLGPVALMHHSHTSWIGKTTGINIKTKALMYLTAESFLFVDHERMSTSLQAAGLHERRCGKLCHIWSHSQSTSY